MRKPTFFERIMYHYDRKKKSDFSIGYVQALEDNNRVRNHLNKVVYPKRIKEYSAKKRLTDEEKGLLSIAKGYRACISDLDK